MPNKKLIAAFVFLFHAPTAVGEPMRFELQGTGGNCNGCEWLAAKGEIRLDSAEQLRAYLTKEKLTDWKGAVRLDSPGGSLIGGVKLGELIRKQGMSTEVGGSIPIDTARNWPHERTKGDCVSSCAFAYLGGVERWFSSDERNRIGVHQFYDSSALANPSAKVFNSIDFSAQQLLSAMVVDYVLRMGVDPRLVVIASNTLPGDMHYVSQQEADDLKVSWEPRKFDPWAIESYGNGVVAFTKTRDRQTTVTLFCRHDKAPRALVTFPMTTDAKDSSLLFESLGAVSAFGVAATKDKMTMNVKGGLAYWEINLAGLNIADLPKSAAIEPAEYVHALWDTFVFRPSATNLKQSARVALRNCI